MIQVNLYFHHILFSVCVLFRAQVSQVKDSFRELEDFRVDAQIEKIELLAARPDTWEKSTPASFKRDYLDMFVGMIIQFLTFRYCLTNYSN